MGASPCPMRPYCIAARLCERGRGGERAIGVGEILVGRPPSLLRTLLGSCIGILAHDAAIAVGALAHVMLPSSVDALPIPDAGPGKFADLAVPAVIKGLTDAGAKLDRIRVKLAGGARMFRQAAPAPIGDIGARNEEAVRAALAAAGVPVVAHDTGGAQGRHVVLDPASGAVAVTLLDGRRRTL